MNKYTHSYSAAIQGLGLECVDLMEIKRVLLIVFVFALLFCINGVSVRGFEADYSDALAKNLLFLESQRFGYLPPD